MASRTFSLALYNTLLPPALLLMAPMALIKMRRREGRWQDMAQRFGFLSVERIAAVSALPRQDLIWMHAVSVGEVGVARKLIAELIKQSPTQGIVITTTTPTGHRLALEIEHAFPQRVAALHSPVDLSFVARRMLRELQPKQIVLVEAEVWPNLVAQASDLGIPVTLVNARLSPKSERGYQRFRSIVAPVFQMLDHVCVQEEGDIARWAGLGVEGSRIVLTGSVKYDPQGSAPDAAQVALLGALLQQCGLANRPLLLAASTHAGEEKEIAAIYQHLVEQHPTLGLLVVPRHYERGPEVQADLRSLGLPSLLRSQMPPEATTDVLIADSTGELKAWQEHATIVVMGKSFLAHGGQNPAEAVMADKPVVFGPHMENFLPLVALLLGANGAVQVASLAALSTQLDALLADQKLRERLAASGRHALGRHQGATEKTARLLLQPSK